MEPSRLAVLASFLAVGCGLLADEEAKEKPPARPAGASLAIASDRTCLVGADGRVACWGRNAGRQLGVDCSDVCETDGRTGEDVTCCLAPVDVPGLVDVAQLALADESTCALHRDGSVACWGREGSGSSSSPRVVAGLADVRQLVAGAEHFCALLADGTVRCWGDNRHGQLGDGTMAPHLEPVSVPDLGSVTQIAASWQVTCARLADGQARCWGSNEFHDVGPFWRCAEWSKSDARPACSRPWPVPDVSGITRVTPAGCAMTASGGLTCWSYGTGAEPASRDAMLADLAVATDDMPSADGWSTSSLHPAQAVTRFGRVVQFDKAWDNQCALDEHNVVRCLEVVPSAPGESAATVPRSVDLPSAPATRQLAVAKHHACALDAEDSVRCWGDNRYGQLGDGSKTRRASGVLVRR